MCLHIFYKCSTMQRYNNILFFKYLQASKVQKYPAKVPPQLRKNHPKTNIFYTNNPHILQQNLLRFVTPTVPATSKFYSLLPYSTRAYQTEIILTNKASLLYLSTKNKKSRKTALLLALRPFLLLLLNAF